MATLRFAAVILVMVLVAAPIEACNGRLFSRLVAVRAQKQQAVNPAPQRVFRPIVANSATPVFRAVKPTCENGICPIPK